MSDPALDSLLVLAKALSDPARLRIVGVLLERECCACELVDMLGLAQATVSRHLSILVQSGLLLARKEGRWMHYRLPEGKKAAASPLHARYLKILQKQMRDSTTVKKDRLTLRGCRPHEKQTGSS